MDSDVINKLVGGRLKLRRGKEGITQIILAQRVGLSRTSIANIEAGHQSPPLGVLYQICKVLRIEPREIIPTFDELGESPREFAKSFVDRIENLGGDKSAQALKAIFGEETKE